MKKVLLIDDPNKYNSAFVNEGKYSSILYRISNMEDLKKCNNYEDYSCVFFHRSFCGSELACYMVKKSTQCGQLIPIVEFSLGQISHDFNTNDGASYLKLNKEVLYRNLELFLTDYQKTNKIVLELLIYGKQFDVENLRKCATRILKLTSTKHIILSEQDIEPIKEDIAFLISQSQPQIGIQYVDFLKKVQDGEISSDQISYNVKRIVESYVQYGENIHHW